MSEENPQNNPTKALPMPLAVDPMPPIAYGRALRNVLAARDVTAFIGVHDALSATISGQHYDSIFVSGYGFAASHYGLPDVGFIAWTDMLAFVQRLRTILPRHHILVDMDDGYGDPEIAAHVAAAMEQAGASGIVLEDQQRPRRCGHAPGKQVLPLEEYLKKLQRVLAVRREMFIVARTDAGDDDERVRRCQAFDAAGADAVLADGISDLSVLTRISNSVRKPVMFNQIAGGRSPRCTLTQLRAAGVSMVNYSTPGLFVAAEAIEQALQGLKAADGLLPDPAVVGRVKVSEFTARMTQNLIGSEAAPVVIQQPPADVDERVARLSPAKQRLLAARRRALDAVSITSPTIKETAPLSRVQNWFFSAAQIDTKSIALNTTRSIRLTGLLDVERLTAALSQVVFRHSILRTTYEQPTDSSPPRQRVFLSSAVELPLIDLSGLTVAEQQRSASARTLAAASIPFNLIKGPVFRAHLTRFSSEHHVLTLTVHHIAFDGWSAGILQRDLAEAYAGSKNPAPAFQYVDYATWQRSVESRSQAEIDQAYWSRQLAGAKPLELPADHPRPPMLSARGARHSIVLDAETSSAIKAVARANGATLFMTLLAAFKATLHKITASGDLVIGSPIGARDRVECEALIGCFINTLILRTQIDGEMTFADLLLRVRETTINAMKHAGVSYDALVSLINPVRDPSRTPLYSISFQLRNFPKPESVAGGLRVESFEEDNGIARGELLVMADERDDGIAMTFEYCTDLFDASTIEQTADQFAQVLRTVAADPTTRLSQLPISQRSVNTEVETTAAKLSLLASTELTPTQQKLAGLWAEVLDVKEFEPDDDFFALGGHSLRAVVCAAKISEAFGIDLPVIAFFQTPTLAGLAERIEASGNRVAIEADDRSQPLQLSPAQQRLWFLNRYESDLTAYNVAIARRLNGPLDALRLERALNAVVKRHDILRTRYPDAEGIPIVQVVAADAAFVPLVVSDYSTVSTSQREATTNAAIAEMTGQTFDLSVLPLLRARLLRFENSEHVLVIVMHHIICDEWSIRILMDELSACYKADSDTLPPLRSQYTDFAARQHAWPGGADVKNEAAYWINHLAGAPSSSTLPTDRSRPPVQTFRGQRIPLTLSPTVVKKLQTLGRQAHATDFTTMLALFYLLLTRWSGQRDLVVGTPVANRDRPEDQDLIGYLLNTLPLRVKVPESATFRDLLSHVRESVLGGFAHQRLPFEKIIEAINPPRSLGHSPLFQVLFVLRTEGDGRLELPGVTSGVLNASNGGAKFELSMLLSETADGINGVLEYNADLFDAETIRNLAEQYVLLAESVAASGDCSLETLCAPNAAEKQRILHTLNRPAVPASGTVLDLWNEQVRIAPGAIAISFGEKSLSYAEFDARASALAGELARRGIGNEARVGLYLRRSIDTLAALLGVLKAGAAYVPLDPTYPAARLAAMLDDANAAVVLSQSDLMNQPLLAGRQVINLDQNWPAFGEAALPAVSPRQLAYVLYTSGSTGKPKGVAVPHGPAWHLARWQRTHSACNGGTRTLQFTSLNFDVSFQEIFSTWCGGGTLVLIDDITRRDPSALLKHIVDQRIDRLFLPFVALNSLAEAGCKPGAPRAALREVMTAGEQLRVTPSIAQWFASMPGCKLVNQYGPTETHVINTALELDGNPHDWPTMPSIGRPIDHSRLYVLDERQQLLPIGTPGHLFIGGACLANGYFNRPDLTSAAFFSDPFDATPGARMYRTGDLARWNHDGTIQFLGRGDAQVKVQGYRVEPAEIEGAISRIAGVREAVVVAKEDALGGKRLVAYLVSDAPPDIKALRRQLSAVLPAYMVPSAFVRLAKMPLTPSNKIDRSALPDPGGQSIEEEDTGRPPANDIERGLIQIWGEVLGRQSVGVHDNFFEIGGQSLLAVRLFARIEQRFGRSLPLSVLFSSPTVAQIAVMLNETAAPTSDGVVIPLQPNGDRPPLFCLAGINGHVLSYRTLAKLMGSNQPVYGLQVEGLETDRAAMTRLEEIAAFLIGHVRRVQPHGPYALIGYSFGGTVAFEMAQQLRAAGEQVRLLAMLDTSATFDLPRKAWPIRAMIHTRRLIAAGPAQAWKHLRHSGRRWAWRATGTQPAILAAPVPGEDSAVTQAILRVRKASEQALRLYQPRSYDGAITLFRALSQPAWHDFVVQRPQNGWEAFASSVEVYPIADAHLKLLEGSGTRHIAAILCGLLSNGES